MYVTKKIPTLLLAALVLLLAHHSKASPAEYPELSFKAFKVNIPVYIFGIQKDSAATYNDTVHYEIKGVRFGKGEGVLPNVDQPSKEKNSPFEVLATAMYYYRQKDVAKVKDLFDKASHNALSEVMPGQKLDSFVNIMANVKSVKIVMAFEYQNGVVCLTDFEGMGILPVYFSVNNNKYYLSSLKDNKPTMYNIMVYLKANPKPFLPAKIVEVPDTLKQDTLSNMVFKISTPGNYLVIGEDKPGTPVFLLCKDNQAPDINPADQIIKFTAQSHNFVDPGKMHFIAFESNYPVNDIYPVMIAHAQKFSVYVKK